MTKINSIPLINVGIVANTNIDFHLSGNFKFNSKTYSGNGSARFKNGKIDLLIRGQNIISEKEIYFEPDNIDNCQIELKNVTIGVDFHWEQQENQVFQGALKLMVINDKIQAINILPIESYLISVISSEMNANSSLNLLKAHAIISRSWLLAQIVKQKSLTDQQANYTSAIKTDDEYIKWYDREDHEHFNVCADDHCQRYQGITRAQNPNVVIAVNETKGIVLEFEGEICDARFSKCCGGVSEVFENCWEPIHHPYLSKVVDKESNENQVDLTSEVNATEFINGNPDAFCNTNDEKILSQVLNNYDHSAKDFYRWEVAYSQEYISELIQKKSGIDFGTIEELIPIERGESGRLIKLKIIGTNKTLTVGKELEIRRWLSESHLYSSAITINKDVQNGHITYKIKGAGWGHGVGLCQIGAAVMGEKGYDYKEILIHYYRNASLIGKY